MKISNISKENFKAMPIAKARVNYQGIQTNYDIFSIVKKDYPTMGKIYETIDLGRIAPKMNEYDRSLWRSILQVTFNSSILEKMKTLLLVKDNEPCGTLKYTDFPNLYFINGRTTWRKENQNKLPFAGKVLSLTLFNLLLRENKNQIKTNIIRVGGFNNVFKAMELGFSSYGGDELVEDMRISQSQIKKILEKFKDVVSIDLIDSAESKDIDLEEVVEI